MKSEESNSVQISEDNDVYSEQIAPFCSLNRPKKVISHDIDDAPL